jgi:hypothetical protein
VPANLLREHDLSCGRLVLDHATVIPREDEGGDARSVVRLARGK